MKPIALDGQGNNLPGLTPVSISGDGHSALFLDTNGDLFLALTGF
jgi:hypothetical protein